MHNEQKVTKSVYWIGSNDFITPRFDNYIPLKRGISYNSYFIDDEKTCILDAVDNAARDLFLGNVKELLHDRPLDYIIVNHMEPDHSGSLLELAKRYPEAKICATPAALKMFEQYFHEPMAERYIRTNEKLVIDLGHHKMRFIPAPMVHWPEVMVEYEKTEKILFSADGFGKFGALDSEDDEGWACEARRYYFNIVGKYGAQVQKLLKAAATLDIQTICPLHGPILTENLGHYLEKYDIWSSYKVESEGVVIAYTSVYGNTKKAVELLAQKLEEKGCPKVTVFDLARDDMAKAVEDAFRYGKLVLATITYNGDIFPFMRTYIENLTERSYQNRTIGLIENGSWAPAAARIMQGMFEKSKNITWLENNVKITSSLSEANEAEIEAMAEELCK